MYGSRYKEIVSVDGMVFRILYQAVVDENNIKEHQCTRKAREHPHKLSEVIMTRTFSVLHYYIKLRNLRFTFQHYTCKITDKSNNP